MNLPLFFDDETFQENVIASLHGKETNNDFHAQLGDGEETQYDLRQGISNISGQILEWTTNMQAVWD